MKETTRQLILLLGVLTLLTSGLVAWNISRTSSTDQPGDSANQSIAENTGKVEPVNNGTGKENNSTRENPNGIIEQSIRGFEIMFRDMRVAMGAVSGKSAQTP